MSSDDSAEHYRWLPLDSWPEKPADSPTMCKIQITSYTQCPPSHNTSSTLEVHDQAIYCANQQIKEYTTDDRCPRCQNIKVRYSPDTNFQTASDRPSQLAQKPVLVPSHPRDKIKSSASEVGQHKNSTSSDLSPTTRKSDQQLPIDKREIRKSGRTHQFQFQVDLEKALRRFNGQETFREQAERLARNARARHAREQAIKHRFANPSEVSDEPQITREQRSEMVAGQCEALKNMILLYSLPTDGGMIGATWMLEQCRRKQKAVQEWIEKGGAEPDFLNW